MIWIEDDGITAWCCSDCQWSIAAPYLESTVAAIRFNRVAQESVEKHNCAARLSRQWP